jgi:putative acetyltransferase
VALGITTHLHSFVLTFSFFSLPAQAAKGDFFWTVWSECELLGCGALKELAPDHGEVKSMRTAEAHRRQGVARAMLDHILEEARGRGYARVSLETGSQDAFAPARRLYERSGFTTCVPFDGYVEDPNSVFMTRIL